MALSSARIRICDRRLCVSYFSFSMFFYDLAASSLVVLTTINEAFTYEDVNLLDTNLAWRCEDVNLIDINVNLMHEDADILVINVNSMDDDVTT